MIPLHKLGPADNIRRNTATGVKLHQEHVFMHRKEFGHIKRTGTCTTELGNVQVTAVLQFIHKASKVRFRTQARRPSTCRQSAAHLAFLYRPVMFTNTHITVRILPNTDRHFRTVLTAEGRPRAGFTYLSYARSLREVVSLHRAPSHHLPHHYFLPPK